MKLNKKFVIVALTLLTLVWTGNIYYYKKHVITEPVFMKHYYGSMYNFPIYYVQDIHDKREICSMSFPEIGNYELQLQPWISGTDNRYYREKSILVNIPYEDKYKNKVITKARVQFSDGKVTYVNIGKIYLEGDVKNNKILHELDTYESDNYKGDTSFKTDRDIKIKGIYSKFSKILRNNIKIDLNGKPLNERDFPIEVKKDDTFTLEYRFEFSKDDININYEYAFPINILVEDSDGNKEYGSFIARYHLSVSSGFDINSIKNNKGMN